MDSTTLTRRDRRLIRQVTKALRAEFERELAAAVQAEREHIYHGLRTVGHLNGSGLSILKALTRADTPRVAKSWDESRHPRADHGQFTATTGGPHPVTPHLHALAGRVQAAPDRKAAADAIRQAAPDIRRAEREHEKGLVRAAKEKAKAWAKTANTGKGVRKPLGAALAYHLADDPDIDWGQDANYFSHQPTDALRDAVTHLANGHGPEVAASHLGRLAGHPHHETRVGAVPRWDRTATPDDYYRQTAESLLDDDELDEALNEHMGVDTDDPAFDALYDTHRANKVAHLVGLLKDWDRFVEEENGRVEKAFDPSLHPRDDRGRFIHKDDIAAAAKDPAKAAELRAQVTDPEQRKKLDAALKEQGEAGAGKDEPAVAQPVEPGRVPNLPRTRAEAEAFAAALRRAVVGSGKAKPGQCLKASNVAYRANPGVEIWDGVYPGDWEEGGDHEIIKAGPWLIDVTADQFDGPPVRVFTEADIDSGRMWQYERFDRSASAEKLRADFPRPPDPAFAAGLDTPAGRRLLQQSAEETKKPTADTPAADTPAPGKRPTVDQSEALARKLMRADGPTTTETVKRLQEAFSQHTKKELEQLKQRLGIRAGGSQEVMAKRLAERAAAYDRSNRNLYVNEKVSVDDAHARITAMAKDGSLRTPQGVTQLTRMIAGGLTGDELRELKGRLGIKASGPKMELARKLVERATAEKQSTPSADSIPEPTPAATDEPSGVSAPPLTDTRKLNQWVSELAGVRSRVLERRVGQVTIGAPTGTNLHALTDHFRAIPGVKSVWTPGMKNYVTINYDPYAATTTDSGTGGKTVGQEEKVHRETPPADAKGGEGGAGDHPPEDLSHLYGGKQPWQMTKPEWDAHFNDTRPNAYGSGGSSKYGGGGRTTSEAGYAARAKNVHDRQAFLKMGLGDVDAVTGEPWDAKKHAAEGMQQAPRHGAVVRAALAAGKPVPPEVLADYPDLKPKGTAPASPPPAAADPAAAPGGGRAGGTAPKSLDDLPVVRDETWDDGTKIRFHQSPFRKLDRQVEYPSGSQTRAAKPATVDLGDLHATQEVVTDVGVKKDADNSHGLPLVVQSNGIKYIQDGHHRLTKEMLAGKTSAKVRFVNLDK